ncbi:MAG TPA: hypothetical protein VIO57_07510 [Chloroflexota bacterium]|jgi:hypothetical protein
MRTDTDAGAYIERLGVINEFGPADLEANRQGVLTAGQRRRLGDDSRIVLTFASIFVGLGVVFAVVAAAAWHLGNGIGPGTAAVAGACLLVAAATVMRSRQVQRESSAPHIAVYEGQIVKLTSAQVPPARARTAAYFYAIEGAHLPVSQAAYEMLDESLSYRVFFLVRTQQLLSLESIPADGA